MLQVSLSFDRIIPTKTLSGYVIDDYMEFFEKNGFGATTPLEFMS